MNISSENLEYLFCDKNKYIIETIKNDLVFNPKRWSETFGKSLSKNIVEAKILHTSTGLELALKRYAINPHMQTLEFAGLHSYTEKSIFLQALLKEIWGNIQECFIRRVDIAIDFEKIPLRIEQSLKKQRNIFFYMNTTYFKSAKEKKSNSRLNFLIYDKAKKENLQTELKRLEVVFRGSYFNNIKVKDLHTQFIKMEKTIKRFTGQTTTILCPIS